MKCPKCKAEHPGPKRYCRECNNAYNREWRATHPLTDEQKLKANARAYTRVYIRRGKLIPEPCAVCDDPKVEAHHLDYSKPLDVVWLCRVHHIQLHQGRVASEVGEWNL